MKSKVNFREGQETNCLIWLKGSLFFYFWDLEFCQSATHPTLPAVSTWTSPPLLWFTGPTSAHLPPLDPLECSTSLLQPTTCWILTDGAPRSSMENTHHLLQLLSLTTIFEFDGFSKYIPRLTCRRGGYKSSGWCSNRKLLWTTNSESSTAFQKESQTGMAPSCEEILQLIINQIKVKPHGSCLHKA